MVRLCLENCIRIVYTLDMRTQIQTLRFTQGELREARQFLKLNPGFASLSTLGRVAVLDFIRTKTYLPLVPVGAKREAGKPSFLWDYDLSHAEVLEILRHRPMEEKKWLISRILEHAQLSEAMEYLSVEDIAQGLPHLRLRPKIKAHWQKAIDIWTRKPKKGFDSSKAVDRMQENGVRKIIKISRRLDAKDYVDLYYLIKDDPARIMPLMEQASKKDAGVDPFLWSRVIADAQTLRVLPRMIHPLTLEDLQKFFMRLQELILSRIKPA